MKALFLMIALGASFTPPQDRPEIIAIKAEYVAVKQDTRNTLGQLRDLYAKDVARRENNDRILGRSVDDDAELADYRRKLAETDAEIRALDQELAALPSDDQLLAEYRKALALASRERQKAIARHKRPPVECADWMLRADRDANLGGLSYKIVCGHRARPAGPSK